MLKITTRTGGKGIVFVLEGNLAGPWVPELECYWQEVVATEQPVKIILKTVAFIDDRGRKLLVEMHRQGVKLMAEGCMTSAIVDEIVRGDERERAS